MHIHLDALGGMAGDMFAAALLDAFPEHAAGVTRSVAAASRESISCALLPHNDGVLAGHRFRVADGPASYDHAEHHHIAEHHHHAHRRWADIRDDLAAADLDVDVRDQAIAIFSHLAEAEARVHGIKVSDVSFHEVGAWDSIADIVAAAHLVVALAPQSWSVGALPLGSGRIATAHGLLPVPAPATALLLEGFDTIDDGIGGERVTPTGAAILRHICGAAPTRPRTPRRLGRTGVGFGTRTLPGVSNCLRVLAFDENAVSPPAGHRELGVIEFEVDDQSPEDLAIGLDRLRAHPDVFDVVQMPVFGKKGRVMTHVRLLARASAMDAAATACFRETTTIGLRHHVVSGAALDRAMQAVDVDGVAVRVKTVERPGGRTAKAEADDALKGETHAVRAALRREAERRALRQHGASHD